MKGNLNKVKSKEKGKFIFLMEIWSIYIFNSIRYEGDFREDYKWGYGKLVQKDKKEILMSYEGDFVED